MTGIPLCHCKSAFCVIRDCHLHRQFQESFWFSSVMKMKCLENTLRLLDPFISIRLFMVCSGFAPSKVISNMFEIYFIIIITFFLSFAVTDSNIWSTNVYKIDKGKYQCSIEDSVMEGKCKNQTVKNLKTSRQCLNCCLFIQQTLYSLLRQPNPNQFQMC